MSDPAAMSRISQMMGGGAMPDFAGGGMPPAQSQGGLLERMQGNPAV